MDNLAANNRNATIPANNDGEPPKRHRPAALGHVSTWAFPALLLFLIALLVTHAWMVDDAYITLRTVDNSVNGHGLRWNVGERVQSYTHPLWMFLVSGLYAVTREGFFTVVVLSFVLTVAAVFVATRALDKHRPPWAKALFLGALLSSKAFLDYSSSGLENPLTHFLCACFLALFLYPHHPWRQAPLRQMIVLFTIASLAFLNRQDTALLFAPACVLVLTEQPRGRRLLALRAVAWAALPAVAWLSFALFYYGAFVPNTAFAKLVGPRLLLAEKLRAGVAYFVDSLWMDVATLPLCGLAMFLSARSRDRRSIAVALGIFLYLSYVLMAGAVGTHMSGRFFSSAAFLAAFLLATLAAEVQQAVVVGAAAAIVLVASPFSPLKVGSSCYAEEKTARPGGIVDTRQFALVEGAGVLDVAAHVDEMPRHAWFRAGLDFRAAPQTVHDGGPGNKFAVGYSGFAAGPSKHIIDALGLTDPLLSRLPISANTKWRAGHFPRPLPAGYKESIENGDNRIEDPDLRAYYDVIRLITREPLLSGRRLTTLAGFIAGRYDRHLQAYARSHGLRW